MAVGGDSATSTTAKTQLTLFVTIHVSPENIEKFKEAHRPVWAQCAREDECLLFDVFQDTECPERFRFVELWSRDREWFEKEQLTKPYYKTLWEKSRPLWIVDCRYSYGVF